MNKKILITGSTDGIGKLVAIKFAKDGHTVYLHGRNKQKLDATISEVKEVSKNDNVSGFQADFSDLNSVKMMAKEVQEKVSEIDVLINNAGVFKSNSPTSLEGLDMRFTVNFLAPYILTKELLPLLKSAHKSRLINLSSAAQTSVSLEALKGEIPISEQDGYAQSKLALTLWSFYLSTLQDNPTVVAVNPGSLLNTNMVREAYGHHWSSANKGADILYELATSDAFQGITGRYFDNDKGAFSNAHPDAYNEKLQKELIYITDQLLKT